MKLFNEIITINNFKNVHYLTSVLKKSLNGIFRVSLIVPMTAEMTSDPFPEVSSSALHIPKIL